MKTAVTAVLLGLLVAPAAWGQTTTTTSVMTTTTVSGPTLPGPRPPDAFLASASGQVKGEIFNYCWTGPGSEPGTDVRVCADRFFPVDPEVALTVQAGDPLTLRFDRPITPTSITVIRRDNPAPSPTDVVFDIPAGNPTQFTLDAPPGTYFVSVFTRWEQGDATYVFEVVVVAPTTTTTTTGPPADSCEGLTPTIVGTNGRDSLVGTSGPDVILGRGGNDVIRGLDGDDTVCGGDGADVVHGGEGSDRLLGQAGDDHLVGHNGDDAIVGGPGNDRLLGGAGADSLSGGGGRDVCLGDRGVDTASACESTHGLP